MKQSASVGVVFLLISVPVCEEMSLAEASMSLNLGICITSKSLGETWFL